MRPEPVFGVSPKRWVEDAPEANNWWINSAKGLITLLGCVRDEIKIMSWRAVRFLSPHWTGLHKPVDGSLLRMNNNSLITSMLVRGL